MKSVIPTTLVLLASSLSPLLTGQVFANEKAVKPPAVDKPEIVIKTTGGLKIYTADKAFSFKLGGRVQWDFDVYDGALTADNDRRSGGDLRRARIELGGTFYTDWRYVFTVNLGQANSSGKTNFSSVGISYHGWDWGSVFVGRTKEPFGLEELTSSKSITSIERAYWVEATDVDSQPNYGIRVDGFSDFGLGWSAAINNPSGGPKDDSGQENFAFTGRLFYAPIAEPGHTLHFGAAFTDRGIDDPVELNGFKLDIAEHGGKLDSRKLLLDEDRQWQLEAVMIRGQVSLQGEYFHRHLGGAAGGPDGDVDGYYIQLAYTLTGESRGYKNKVGYIDSIKPGAGGAWEVVLKYDYIEFDQDGFDTEEVSGVLIGTNYYPNRNMKIMLNYIAVDSRDLASTADGDSDADVLSLRLQFAF
ncbi:MAG: porin [Pseudomonadales bacterium]|nr:porin [Pseudomonadales bacterium]